MANSLSSLADQCAIAGAGARCGGQRGYGEAETSDAVRRSLLSRQVVTASRRIGNPQNVWFHRDGRRGLGPPEGRPLAARVGPAARPGSHLYFMSITPRS